MPTIETENSAVIVPTGSTDFFGQTEWTVVPASPIAVAYLALDRGVLTPDDTDYITNDDSNRYIRLKFHRASPFDPENFITGTNFYLNFRFSGLKITHEVAMNVDLYTDYPTDLNHQITATYQVGLNTAGILTNGGLQMAFINPKPTALELQKVSVLLRSVVGLVSLPSPPKYPPTD